jgi:hypothetical protein
VALSDPIQFVEDNADLEAGVDLRRSRRQERRQQVAIAVGVQLCPELGEQLREVRLVFRANDVAHVALGAGPFPVDVDAVEDPGCGAWASHSSPAGIGKVSLDEQVDAGRDEALPR